MPAAPLKYQPQKSPYKKASSTYSRQKTRRVPKNMPVTEDVRIAAKPAIQSTIFRYKPRPSDLMTKEQSDFDKTAKRISELVQKAYEELIAGNLAGAGENYILNYKRRLGEFKSRNPTIHPSVAAGYVIESKVNNKIQDIDWGNHRVTLQDHSLIRGSIPDISIRNSNEHYALLDITASNSAGHIFDKKGNWLNHDNIVYVAELIYPSIDFTMMKPMTLTPEEQERLERFTFLKQQEEEEWQKFCQEDLLAHHDAIAAAIAKAKTNGYPFYGKCSKRQWSSLQYNFALFGFKIYRINYAIYIKTKGNFLQTTNYERYSPTDMLQYRNELIKHIKNLELAGMRSFRA